jgi:hypothetical protein
LPAAIALPCGGSSVHLVDRGLAVLAVLVWGSLIAFSALFVHLIRKKRRRR